MKLKAHIFKSFIKRQWDYADLIPEIKEIEELFPLEYGEALDEMGLLDEVGRLKTGDEYEIALRKWQDGELQSGFDETE